jgi:hypothetical protein
LARPNTALQSDRNEFEQTLHSLKTRKFQLKAIGILLSRFDAQLTRTNNAVDGVVTGVISLRGRSSRESALIYQYHLCRHRALSVQQAVQKIKLLLAINKHLIVLK